MLRITITDMPPTQEGLTDAELVAVFLQGDAAAFEMLVKRYSGQIYRFLARLVGQPQSAQDLTQETFVKVWKNLSRFDRQKSFKTWMFTIARNTAFDHLRKQRALPIVSDDEESATDDVRDQQPLPDAVMQNKELAHELEGALEHLVPEDRAIILMHEVEGMTFQDIAEVVSRPMNTVKSRYRRALFRLKSVLLERLHQDDIPVRINH